MNLTNCRIGDRCFLLALPPEPMLARRLARLGFRRGVELTLLSVGGRGECRILIGCRRLTLTKYVAAALWVGRTRR